MSKQIYQDLALSNVPRPKIERRCRHKDCPNPVFIGWAKENKLHTDFDNRCAEHIAEDEARYDAELKEWMEQQYGSGDADFDYKNKLEQRNCDRYNEC